MPDTPDAYGDAVRDAERAAAAGDFVVAEAALRRALARHEADLGAAHPDLASTLNNLAVVCETNGRLEDAERFYRRAYAVASAALPPDDPLVETSRANLEDFCRAHARPVDDWPELGQRSASLAATPDLPPAPSVAPTAPRPPATAPRPATPAPPPSPAARGPRATPVAASPPASSAAPALRGFVATLAVLAVGGTLALAWFALGGDAAAPVANRDASTREAPAPAQAPTTTPTRSDAAAVATPEPSVAAPTRAPVEAAPPPVADVTSPPKPPPPTAEAPRTARPGIALGTAEPRLAPEATAARLVDATVCTRLRRQGRRWTCTPAGDAVDAGALTFYTRVATARATRIEHRWYRNGQLARTIALSIGASASDGYRTFSQQTVTSGRWRVEARTADGRVLGDASVEVRD